MSRETDTEVTAGWRTANNKRVKRETPITKTQQEVIRKRKKCPDYSFQFHK
jgi:hypothetical protein